MTSDQDEQIDFHHPYTPYHIQTDFMNALYDALENYKIGIFESPTGTGKTLSLICASMTWLRNNQKRELEDQLKKVDDSDDPEWVKKEAREMKIAEHTEKIKEFEKKLEQIRRVEEQEQRIAQQPREAVKKRRIAKTEEADFLVDDYESDDERVTNRINNNGYSAEVQALLDQQTSKNSAENVDDEEEKEGTTRIFFASRTHSQLSQFVGQLKMVKFPSSFTEDKDEMVKEISLSSRQQLCIHKKVSLYQSVTAKNDACLDMQKKESTRCEFMLNTNKLDDKAKSTEFRNRALAKVRDIEDLAELGRDMHVCPYYESRRAVSHSEIVTLPYQLLIQRSARKALGIDIKNSVVIIDEAHNIMDTISSLFSLSVTGEEVSRARQGLEVYQHKFHKRLNGGNKIYLAQTVKCVKSLEQFFLDAEGKSAKETKPGVEVNQQRIIGDQGAMINVYKLEKYLEKSKLAFKIESYLEATSDHAPRLVLSKVISFLMAISNPASEGKVFYDRSESNRIQLNYLLLDPSEHFREVVENARAVVLAGGTMEPVGDYLNYLFPYVDKPSIKLFSCGHVIPDKNLAVATVESGPASKQQFTFTYANRNNTQMIDQLGKSLINFSAVIPAGLVVFFPSYHYLNELVKIWTSNGTMTRLEARKKVFMEPRESSVESVLAEYRQEIDTNHGAILFSVVGGKMSEGINFSDNLARGVVMIGLPFPNLLSAEMVAKRDYIESNVISKGGTKQQALEATKDFYENICMRAVNQSIGRAIRHANDYAAILLIDSRYGTDRIQNKLPQWIRTRLDSKADKTFANAVKTLGGFFRTKRV